MALGALAFGPELPPAADLKQRIVGFVRGGSTEITPGDIRHLPELTALLPSGTDIYVAHTRWMAQVADGGFEIDSEAGRLRLDG